MYSEGRSLYISLSRFPFGEEIRELSKGSHTSGHIALATVIEAGYRNELFSKLKFRSYC